MNVLRNHGTTHRPGGPPSADRRPAAPPPLDPPPSAQPPVGRHLRAGDLLEVTSAASVQFTVRPILFRLIRVLDWVTFDGWVWLDGYQLDAGGDAVARRSIFVQEAGLRKLPEVRTAQPRRAPNAGRHGSTRPVRRAANRSGA